MVFCKFSVRDAVLIAATARMIELAGKPANGSVATAGSIEAQKILHETDDVYVKALGVWSACECFKHLFDIGAKLTQHHAQILAFGAVRMALQESDRHVLVHLLILAKTIFP